MAAKAAIPAPIDRPLSKAYLREFKGWSTAFPPGVSEPTSLRTMHNCSVAADGSLKIRPGLRHVLSAPFAGDIVGEFEHFYTSDGFKALLFAVRDEPNNRVVFRTAVYNPATQLYDPDPTIGTRFDGATDADLALWSSCTYVRYLQIDNKILALSDNNQPFRLFFVSAFNMTAKVPQAIPVPGLNRETRLTVMQPAASWVSGSQVTIPTAETPTTSTLVSSTSANNQYNFAYFYSMNNEIGETEVSQLTPIRVQRPWAAWVANASDETKSNDQIVAYMPEATWNAAVAAGATSWNLYFLTWSDQSAVPVEGVLLKTIEMAGKTYQQAGWAAHTPLIQPLNQLHPLPSVNNRTNYTEPSKAAQGLVAGDRLVLVRDMGANGARIQWSSNQQGDYLNFSSSKGGGYKTLTSGNLYLPAAVKLWQNPQSADTITVLCAGLDGYGTSYYMNSNSSVTTQTQLTTIMGFEETTATPGTVAPYGCEVLNNALYHPLENNLMKSSASNYNINHAMMADNIANIWSRIPLDDKAKMVSSQMDSSLYYLVNSPVGWYSAAGANGNQVWICDTALSGVWSCWDVVGTSLKKLEVDGLLYMAICSGPNVYVFDPEHDSDDVWDGAEWTEVGIPWEAVTNTQGANRAHDAWAQLQQINVTFGDFSGECVYGIRGKDVNGRMVELSKHYISPIREHDPLERYDLQDFLLCRRIMQQWEFFWRSADFPKNRSYGSVSFVQYRYTPITVNVGYEYGAVETFEYGTPTASFDNGVPLPFADTNKP